MSLLELFVEVDDFCQAFEKWAAKQQLPGAPRRGPKPVMADIPPLKRRPS